VRQFSAQMSKVKVAAEGAKTFRKSCTSRLNENSGTYKAEQSKMDSQSKLKITQ